MYYQGSTIRFCIHWPVDFKSYWPPKKVTVPICLHEYTFILIKTGRLYNKIYLFIFRTMKDTALEITF